MRLQVAGDHHPLSHAFKIRSWRATAVGRPTGHSSRVVNDTIIFVADTSVEAALLLPSFFRSPLIMTPNALWLLGGFARSTPERPPDERKGHPKKSVGHPRHVDDVCPRATEKRWNGWNEDDESAAHCQNIVLNSFLLPCRE